MLLKPQGKNSSQLFSGQGVSNASKMVYGANEKLYLTLIRKTFSPKETIQLVDLGGFKGEFTSRILKDLPSYKFEVTAVDSSASALKLNQTAKIKLCKDLTKTTLPNKYATLTILRYVLSWNTLKEQEGILKEAKRITNKFLIISHQGPLEEEAKNWRTKWAKLFSGRIIRKLKREGYYFSSAQDIESLMDTLQLKYKQVEQKNVKNILDLFVEKYALSKSETEKARAIVTGVNTIQITTWIIKV